MSGALVHAAEPLQWVRDGRATTQALSMSRVLAGADVYGLAPDSYRSQLTRTQLQQVVSGSADSQLLRHYDQDLSQRVSRFATHLHYGRVEPRAAGFDLPARTASTPPDSLRRLAESNGVEAALAELEPTPVPYRLLKESLARYRELARDPTMTTLPALPGHSLRLGDSYAGASQLRERLKRLGDLSDTGPSSGQQTLDAALVQGLEHFQARHGLRPDGVLGARTLQALNVPLQKRVRQIELSLERWRWLSSMPRPDIVINVPQFMLYALPRPARPGESMLEMPVIVGRTIHRTPVFTASIEQVIFNPYWDVPSSIMRSELLPKIRKDVSYLKRHHFEIVRGAGDDAIVEEPTAAVIDALQAGQLRLRQRPGPDNALGPVKFVLPNPYSVRLHGTSEPGLFEFPQRAFSHGCIRVSDPAALAEYVLANAPGEWDAATVETALCGTEPRRVVLKVPVRVLVFYATAAATNSRGLMFAEDIYRLDARLEKLLALSPQS